MATVEEIADRGARAFNEHDIEAIQQLYAENVRLIAPGGMEASGNKAAAEFNQNWWKGFPNARTESLQRTIAGDVITEVGTFRGTHTGVFPTPMGDIPPTGKEVTGDYIMVSRVQDGRIVEERLMFDRLQLLEQLGLVPAGAAAG